MNDQQLVGAVGLSLARQSFFDLSLFTALAKNQGELRLIREVVKKSVYQMMTDERMGPYISEESPVALDPGTMKIGDWGISFFMPSPSRYNGVCLRHEEYGVELRFCSPILVQLQFPHPQAPAQKGAYVSCEVGIFDYTTMQWAERVQERPEYSRGLTQDCPWMHFLVLQALQALYEVSTITVPPLVQQACEHFFVSKEIS